MLEPSTSGERCAPAAAGIDERGALVSTLTSRLGASLPKDGPPMIDTSVAGPWWSSRLEEESGPSAVHRYRSWCTDFSRIEPLPETNPQARC